MMQESFVNGLPDFFLSEISPSNKVKSLAPNSCNFFSIEFVLAFINCTFK